MISSLRPCLCIAAACSIANISDFHLFAAGPPAPLSAAAADPRPLVFLQDEVQEFKSDMDKRAVALLTAGDFPGLDAMARDFRKSQAGFANGGWKLNYFYQELSEVEDKAPEKDWEVRLASTATMVRSRHGIDHGACCDGACSGELRLARAR